jgi:hypothetical protein
MPEKLKLTVKCSMDVVVGVEGVEISGVVIRVRDDVSVGLGLRSSPISCALRPGAHCQCLALAVPLLSVAWHAVSQNLEVNLHRYIVLLSDAIVGQASAYCAQIPLRWA